MMNEADARTRAAELEGGSAVNRWKGVPENTDRKPVRVRMPSGQVITTGGENLVRALVNGAEPVA
jgi:hypothetical protein